MKDELLWEKIKNFRLDEKDAEFSFSKRLARENNWSLDFTKKAILEYRKFIYLCCISDRQITPSDAVDQVWHLHLTYTKSYWEDFCMHTIGKAIHHNPTKGGNRERLKFSDCYDATFEIYKSEFRHNPPNLIWLNKQSRFREINFKRINVDEFWFIKKPSKKLQTIIKLLVIGIFTPILFIRAEGNFSIVIPFLIVLVIVLISFYTGDRNNGGDNSGCSTGCTFHGDSGCSSGCSGCSGCGGGGD